MGNDFQRAQADDFRANRIRESLGGCHAYSQARERPGANGRRHQADVPRLGGPAQPAFAETAGARV